jgi:hypothetical protein
MLLPCQHFVEAGVGGGDSGSPVFRIESGTDNVTLYGVLWGGASDGSFLVYSPIANVRRELGPLDTFGDGNTAPTVTINGPADGPALSLELLSPSKGRPTTPRMETSPPIWSGPPTSTA